MNEPAAHPAPSTAAPDVRLQMLSNPHFLAGARELLGNIAKRLGFSDEAAGHIALATDEALCNVIRHGYDKAPDRPIWISIYALGGVPLIQNPGGPSPTTGLKIVIEDEAKQVDLSVIKSRDLDEVRPGGLGVHIIQEVMDSATYEHRQPKGMRLTMIKHRSTAPAPPTTDPSCSPSSSSKVCGDRP